MTIDTLIGALAVIGLCTLLYLGYCMLKEDFWKDEPDEYEGEWGTLPGECRIVAGNMHLTARSINLIPYDPSILPPIDMLLFCPNCHEQHIDAPEGAWDNPPHRSHLCGHCGILWRPSDHPTNGVAAIKTAGKDDNYNPQGQVFDLGRWQTTL